MATTTRMNKTIPQAGLTPSQIRAIAKEAYIFGFPLVDSYRIQYSYFVDRNNPEYKAGWNKIYNTARVYTPEDKAIQSPNSDTPYSFIGADLRAEPLVLTVPQVENDRYFSIQFIDMYTFNFAYVGSRATGNDGGNFLLTGPDWSGTKPSGIKDVIQCETEFAFVLYRTQLFNEADLENVKKIQAGYKVQTLSDYLKQLPPPAVEKIDFIKPLSKKQQETSVEFFNILNFVLRFCPSHPSERALRTRFAKLGILPGADFYIKSPEIKEEIEAGIREAWSEYNEVKKLAKEHKINSKDLFGSREHLANNYAYRMMAAKDGIYGNSAEEAFYPAYFLDTDGKMLDGTNQYKLRFEQGKLPPVRAFWSLTLYELPSSLLYSNPLNRYLVNSPMLPHLEKDGDGGITLYIQNESPGREKETNWLPAPKGPFFCALRLYWPKPEVLSGQWKEPPLERQK